MQLDEESQRMLKELAEKVGGKSGTREGTRDGNQTGREGDTTSRIATATARSGDPETERTKEATTLEGKTCCCCCCFCCFGCCFFVGGFLFVLSCYIEGVRWTHLLYK